RVARGAWTAPASQGHDRPMGANDPAGPHGEREQHGLHDPHRSTQEKFDSPAAAAVYATKHVGRSKDRLEKACITRALADVPKGALILDLPCGTGRITTQLLGLGVRVGAAGYSVRMFERAPRECM